MRIVVLLLVLAGSTRSVLATQLTCQLENGQVSAGGTVSLNVFVQDVAALQGYQTRISITQTSGSGTVSVVCPGGVHVDEARTDYVFLNLAQTFPTVNCQDLKALGVAGDDVNVGAATLKYLSDYTLTVSADAAPGSTFDIAVLASNGSGGSQLADSQGAAIPFTVGGTCTLTVRCESATPVQITAVPDTAVCEGTNITLDAGAGFPSYLWSPGGETTRKLEVAATGTYGVTVIDDDDCFATGTINVTIEPLPNCAISSVEETCPGGVFVASTIAGLASYDWSVVDGAILSGQGTRAVRIKAGTEPEVKVDVAVTSAGGCASDCSKTVSVSDDEAPVITNCPSSLTLTLNAECEISSIPADLGVDVSDNCTALGDLTITTDPEDLGELGVGEHEVVVTITDATGNDSSCAVTVTIEEGECTEPVTGPLPCGFCAPSAAAALPLLILGLLAWKLKRRRSAR